MRDLSDLVGLVNKSKLKSSSAFKLIIEPGSKMEFLFEAIADKRVQSDDDAKALLEAQGDDPSKLSGLKNKLKDRLLDCVFLLDFKESSYSNRQKAFFECYKKWSAAMTLLIRNVKSTGIDLLERLFRHSARFEFTELCLDILRVLKLQYSTVNGDAKAYEWAKTEYQKYEKIWVMESKAEEYYSELMLQFTNSKATKTDLKETAEKYYAELKPFMDECGSFKLHLFGRMIHLLVHNIVNDYVEVAKLCEEAIAFFDKKEYDSGLPLQVFYYNLIVCYLQLKEFEKGQEIITRCEEFFEKGTFNWFKLQELFFLLSMHTGHYSAAYQTFDRVTTYPRFEEKEVQIVEMWRIFEAYLYYLIKIEKIPADEVLPRHAKLKMHKLLNELVVFVKDKRGMNISILIVEILYTIAEKDYDTAIERIDGFEKYCSRYLKDPDTFRSNNFIRMLLQIPLAGFHKEAVSRKTEKYYKQLTGKPLEAANQAHEIEIVPYEALWSMTTELLDNKIFKQRKK